jgi:hypothetical protein
MVQEEGLAEWWVTHCPRAKNRTALAGQLHGDHPPPAQQLQPVNVEVLASDVAALSEGEIPRLMVSMERRAHFEAELALLKMGREREDLVSADDVKKAASRLARTLRDLLLGIPNRNAARLAAMADPDEVRALLQSEIEGALRSLPSG